MSGNAFPTTTTADLASIAQTFPQARAQNTLRSTLARAKLAIAKAFAGTERDDWSLTEVTTAIAGRVLQIRRAKTIEGAREKFLSNFVSKLSEFPSCNKILADRDLGTHKITVVLNEDSVEEKLSIFGIEYDLLKDNQVDVEINIITKDLLQNIDDQEIVYES